MHVSPRNPDRVEAVVIHTNEGPESKNGAQNLAAYLRRNGPNGAGYHEIVDRDGFVLLAHDDQLVYGAGGYNDRGYHICLVGYARQSATEWADAYSTGELAHAAQRAADACKRFGLPAVKLTGTNLLGHRKGLCGHADVSTVYTASKGHTDPGVHFPWKDFIAAVARLLAPSVPIVAGDDMPQIIEQPIRPGEAKRSALKPQVAILGKRNVRLLHGASLWGDRKADSGERVFDVNTPSDLVGWFEVPRGTEGLPGGGSLGGMVALNAEGNPYHLAWS